MNKKNFLMLIASLYIATSKAQTIENDSINNLNEQTLEGVVVSGRASGIRKMKGAINAQELLRSELFKAACCNLGESFVNNPSIDVNYSDATTGARQVKLLGLSGSYVQMLTENLPNFRGAAQPYGLGYVPGHWMKSLQVSKGNASVKNGYEAMTGQINVEYIKPDDPKGASINLFGSSMGKFEANADANIHIGGNENLSTVLLTHFENNWSHHDSNNDGFQDDPQIKQFNVQNRWVWKTNKNILHMGLGILKEERSGGQLTHHKQHAPFRINIDTKRYEVYFKNAFIINPKNGSNIALTGNLVSHNQNSAYGVKLYDVKESNLSTSLMYETNFKEAHNLSLGVNFTYDNLAQNLGLSQNIYPVNTLGSLFDKAAINEREAVIGTYMQYTYTLHSTLVAMAGLRIDHSNRFKTFVTPRFHLKWTPFEFLTLRLSAGKGYRTPHVLAENNYLLASGRKINVEELGQEKAWNYGTNLSFSIPINNQMLKINAEYYYTKFQNQVVVDYDTNPFELFIHNLRGKSYSHTMQFDVSYPFIKGLELTAAYRYNDVKTTYNGILMNKPLTIKHKGLFTASYKTHLGLWQFDATFVLNGGGRLPRPYNMTNGLPSWDNSFKAHTQLNAQITRYYRTFSVYLGGENLTNFKQKNPIIGSENPWANTFEPTLIYGSLSGAMAYVGVRFNLGDRK